MKLLVATNNKGKQKEFARILAETGFEFVFPSDVGLDTLDVAETGSTAKENAYLKASEFAKQSGLLTVADDSGLEIDALDGAPGIHSKRFYLGTEQERNQKIFELLDGVEDRSALFRSVLCLIDPESDLEEYFEGIYYGEISREERGDAGFGYDPIFIPEGETQTVGELGIEYKNTHSHRALAIEKLKEYLKTNLRNS